jgi:LmbE family N-acetylglucosaminyl deacetylase
LIQAVEEVIFAERNMNNTVFMIGCHPDDIEFLMAGTMLLLKKSGCQLHYLNIANGCCGTDVYSKEQIIAMRRAEGMAAADLAGAQYHESYCDDLEVYYTPELIRKVSAVIREVKPSVILTLALEDYMEDHINTGRVVSTAAFTRGMPNYTTTPPATAFADDVYLYHALPWGLCDRLRKPVVPAFYVDTSSVVQEQAELLACHRSQKEWLDTSQGLDSYIQAMFEHTRNIGKMSLKFSHAEGWNQHLHLGYSGSDANPLAEILSDYVLR